MTDKDTLHYQGVSCPECGKRIIIVSSTFEAITIEEHKKRLQEEYKAMKEREKAERKAKR